MPKGKKSHKKHRFSSPYPSPAPGSAHGTHPDRSVTAPTSSNARSRTTTMNRLQTYPESIAGPSRSRTSTAVPRASSRASTSVVPDIKPDIKPDITLLEMPPPPAANPRYRSASSYRVPSAAPPSSLGRSASAVISEATRLATPLPVRRVRRRAPGTSTSTPTEAPAIALPQGLGTYLDTAVSEIARLITPSATEAIVRIVFSQAKVVKDVIGRPYYVVVLTPGQPPTAHEVEEVTPRSSSHVGLVLQASFFLVRSALADLPSSSGAGAAQDSTRNTWWSVHGRPQLAKMAASRAGGVSATEALGVIHQAQWKWLEMASRRNVVDRLKEELDCDVDPKDLFNLVSALAGAADIIISELWPKKKDRK